jgi:hypothetical protein
MVDATETLKRQIRAGSRRSAAGAASRQGQHPAAVVSLGLPTTVIAFSTLTDLIHQDTECVKRRARQLNDLVTRANARALPLLRKIA